METTPPPRTPAKRRWTSFRARPPGRPHSTQPCALTVRSESQCSSSRSGFCPSSLVKPPPRGFQQRALGLMGSECIGSLARAKAWVGMALLKSPGLRVRETVMGSLTRRRNLCRQKTTDVDQKESFQTSLWEKHFTFLDELCLCYPSITCSYF